MDKKQVIKIIGVTAAAFTTAALVRELVKPRVKRGWQDGLAAFAPCGFGNQALVPVDVSEEHFLMPTESIRQLLKPYPTRIQT